MRKQRTKMLAILAATMMMLSACAATSSTGAADVAEALLASDTQTAASTVDSVAVATSVDENAETHDSADHYGYDETDVVAISLGATITATSDGVVIDGTTATITDAGTYRISGTIEDGQLLVDAGDGALVQLILNGVDITNSDGAAIAVMSAEVAVVILAEGTDNMLTDGSVYVLAEGEDEPNAALFSKSDLTLTGEGSLTVSGNYNDGIASKDGLIIDSGVITVVAVDDGIRGKDYVVVNDGQVSVTAGGDGIKADNDEDVNLGFIIVAEGSIEVDSGDDGVQAATDLVITGGTLTVTAGADGTSQTARGVQGDVMVAISGGTVTATSVDDAIHSNATVTIDGGDLTLASGDDGIHGDLFVTVNGGSILITESFEGIESEVITINDGYIDITSSDDGLNVADGSTAETNTVTDVAPIRGAGGGPGAGDEAVGDYYIYINGGTTVITVTDDLDEQGDGIDANGHVEMTGGLVVVSGPTDTRNSALDYSGGSFVATGGTLIGTNINGRNSEGVGIGSTQASMYVTSGSVAEAGTVVHIQTSDGEGLVTFVPDNDFDVIVFTSPDLVAGDSYEIYLGGSVSGESTTGLYQDAAYEQGTLVGTTAAS